MRTEQLTETLTTATAAIASADHDDTRADLISDLAKALAGDDRFVRSFFAHLEDDLDRATNIAWQDGWWLAKAIAAQATSTS